MAVETALHDLMRDEVTVESVSGTSSNGYGEVTFGTPVTYLCHVSYDNRVSRGTQQETLVQGGRIYFRDVVVIDERDRITMPDGSQPVVRSVRTHHDENGPHHTVVEFGMAR